SGANEKGYRPFLDRRDLATGATGRVFQGPESGLESIIGLSADGERLVITRQSPAEVPNVVAIDDGSQGRRQLSLARDPEPEWTGAHKELLRYTRADGTPLSGLLHLPPGYEKGSGRLPVLLGAYPMDYGDAATAGQVRVSDQEFTRLAGAQETWLL